MEEEEVARRVVPVAWEEATRGMLEEEVVVTLGGMDMDRDMDRATKVDTEIKEEEACQGVRAKVVVIKEDMEVTLVEWEEVRGEEEAIKEDMETQVAKDRATKVDMEPKEVECQVAKVKVDMAATLAEWEEGIRGEVGVIKDKVTLEAKVKVVLRVVGMVQVEANAIPEVVVEANDIPIKPDPTQSILQSENAPLSLY